MPNPFDIVKDSSIWQNPDNYAAVSRKDPFLRMGVIKKVYRDQKTTDLRYLVEMRDRNDAIEINCRMLRKFGGAFNYEDIVYHGYKFDDKPDRTQDFDAKAGDAVLVGLLNGEAREGVILGSLMHAARKSTIDITKGPQYKSEFNGIETVINENGEYKVTFKAVPTNVAKLDEMPYKKLPDPTYNEDVGTSYFILDKTGSYEVSDNAKQNLQKMRIDKPAGTIEIVSGKISLKMTKSKEQVDLKCKITNITSDDKITVKTKEFKMEASVYTKVKSPKVAIGKDGIELLDQLSQLIDALGTVIPISPIGPCTALKTVPQWQAVAAVQAKIKEITGTL